MRTGFQGFPCLDDDGSLCGMLTHKDVRDALAEGVDKNAPIASIKSCEHLVVTYPDETLEEAIEKMASSDYGHIPVVDRDDPTKLLGFLTRRDIIQVYREKAKEREDQWK